MNSKYKKWLIILFVLICVQIGYAQIGNSIPITHEFGSHHNISCQGRNCSAILYSYTKYYLENGQWTPIDETIGTQNCLPNYSYCVDRNLYQAHFSQNSIKIVTNGAELTFTPVSLSTQGLTTTYTTPTLNINSNQITYDNVFGNNDLRFTYTPEQLKKELILESLPNTQGDFLSLVFRISYPINTVLSTRTTQFQPLIHLSSSPLISSDPLSIEINNWTMFILNKPFAHDANFSFKSLQYELYYQNTQTYIKIRIPMNWLVNASYPVIIDPTVTLNASNISWDGFVYYDQLAGIDGDPAYFRGGSPDPLIIGHELGITGSPDNIYRSVIQFDTSSIPTNAVIQKINLTLNVTTLGSAVNINISVHHMEKNNSAYDSGQNPCEGNCQFFTDMGNGTNYTNIIITTSQNILDVSNSSYDLQNQITAKWIAYGLTSHLGESTTTGKIIPTTIASASDTVPSRRPYLTIQYIIVANETAGRNAIDLGINQSALGPTNPRDTSQLIYVVGQTGNQYRATFDKFTDRGNQTWIFNYITSGEAFTYVPPLFHVLNIWENTTLEETDITNQVMGFINNTIQ